MNLPTLSEISRLFKRKPDKWKEVEHQIEEAFTVGGRTFYQFTDAFNMPYYRALASINYFEEVKLKCTYEFIEMHQKRIKELLNPEPGKGINIYEINKLNEDLGERLGFVMDEAILWKFATVVFFDDREDPADYSFKYAQEKIKFWREHTSPAEFFFQAPILRYAPYLVDLNDNFREYSEAVQLISKIHTERVRSQSSPGSTEKIEKTN